MNSMWSQGIIILFRIQQVTYSKKREKGSVLGDSTVEEGVAMPQGFSAQAYPSLKYVYCVYIALGWQ